MDSNKILLAGMVLAGWIAVVVPAGAQLQPLEPDPLARMRAAATAAQTQACTTKEPSACAEAAPKIVANALGSLQLPKNLTHLNEIALNGGATSPDGIERQQETVAWAEGAFRDAGVDEVHQQQLKVGPGTVVAEIRGREKPGEFVVLGARLPSNASPSTAADDACNAALVIEAARDIHLTGLRSLRSIRFVLFGGGQENLLGSHAYVIAQRAELDHAIAAAIFEKGCGQVTGFSLGGRKDTEPGVREAFSVAPIDTWNVGKITYDAPWGFDNFDFLLEGVPTLLPNREGAVEKSDLDTMKHNAAIAGVLAFALAEHPAALGPRLSRAEIASLLEHSGLDTAMKTAGVWQLWESGKSGRQ